jgi:hypothetical protein
MSAGNRPDSYFSRLRPQPHRILPFHFLASIAPALARVNTGQLRRLLCVFLLFGGGDLQIVAFLAREML